MEGSIVFRADEVEAAVSEVQACTSDMSLNSPMKKGFNVEPLVQDINHNSNVRLEDQMTQICGSQSTGYRYHVHVSEPMNIGEEATHGNGAPNVNAVATMQQQQPQPRNPTTLLGHDVFADSNGRVAQVNGNRYTHPHGNGTMPSMQGSPAGTVAIPPSFVPHTGPLSNATSTQSAPNTLHPPQENWMDVVHTTGTKHEVRFHYQTNEGVLKYAADSPVWNLPEFASKRLELIPSQVYKFRVAAVNAQGRGPWSEATAYRNPAPGLPGPPNQVKVSKIEEGAKLSWEDPQIQCGRIIEYSVYLSVHPGPIEGSQMSFQRVYSGSVKECIVSNANLKNAFVDTAAAGKPAVIFRIAARNDKAYGPATQVRWLQESVSGIFSPRPVSKRGDVPGVAAAQ
ncbi:unnamed protein product [Orchesella dallaii]|uniref:Fibronectin type-III domain-containing protein n=1 Tax=Orchesella dallaii TaxID=48710 RepID=A0ABP1QN60_9HEXA